MHRLYVITDRTLTDDLVATCTEIDTEGVALQVREKDLEDAALLELAGRIVDAVNVPVLVNGSVDVAEDLGCGVHLTSSQLGEIGDARARLGADALIGVSTHSLSEVERAVRNGANFLVYGPVYETPSKAPYGPPQGISGLRQAVRAAGEIPLLAVGGINVERTTEALQAGARGVAVIRAVMTAADPADVVRQFMDAIEGAT